MCKEECMFKHFSVLLHNLILADSPNSIVESVYILLGFKIKDRLILKVMNSNEHHGFYNFPHRLGVLNIKMILLIS